MLQVALSMALALTAGMYARDFARVATADSGYANPESVLLARIVPRGITPEEGNQFWSALFERLNEMPQVQAAGIGWNPPFAQGATTLRLPTVESGGVRGGATAVSPGFFAAQGTTLVAGREFSTSGEDADGVIVNEMMAESLWPDGDPLGRSVMYGTVERRVVGVVSDERCSDLVGPPTPCAWQPFPNGTSSGYVRIRLSGAPLSFVPVLRSIVRDLDPDVAVAEETVLSGYLAKLTASERLAALTSAALAGFGIVLLAVGCISLFLSMVRESLQEIAIRMSIGATNGRLIARIMTQGFVLTTAGAALGLGAVLLLAKHLGNEVYPAADMGVTGYLGAPTVVAIVALLCVFYSARVATRTDPAKHLQSS